MGSRGGRWFAVSISASISIALAGCGDSLTTDGSEAVVDPLGGPPDRGRDVPRDPTRKPPSRDEDDTLPFTPDPDPSHFGHIDPRPFTIDPTDTFARYAAILQRLENDPRLVKSSLDGLLASANRTGTWGLCHSHSLKASLRPEGFCWDEDDDRGNVWVPQGITGSGDAQPNGLVGGRTIVVASWHNRDDTLARLSFVDLTDRERIRYRHALLVEPTETDGVPGFRSVQGVHADGIVWYGDTLLVATGGRLMAFSLAHVWETDTTTATSGIVGIGDDQKFHARYHAFAIPMIGEYVTERLSPTSWKGCSPTTGIIPCMNSIALDRGGPGGDSFLTAEYYRPRTGAPAGGRVLRWPLDPATGLPRRRSDGKVHATQAFRSPLWFQQGIATDGKAFYVSAYCPGIPADATSNDTSCIHKALPNAAPQVLTKAPELTQNLSYWPSSKRLWGLNERIQTTNGIRVVFALTLP